MRVARRRTASRSSLVACFGSAFWASLFRASARYLDKTSYYKINQLQPSGADMQVVGKIVHIKTVEQKRGKRLVATFVDETGQMDLVWFRGHKWIKENLKINEPYVVFGRVNKYGNTFSMPHPEMESLQGAPWGSPLVVL